MIGFDIVESVRLGGVGESANEVDSILSGVDPLGDVLFEPATSNARAGQKFQPKIKPQPRMGVSKAIASALPNMMGRTHTTCPVVLDSVQSVQSIDVGRSTLADHVGSFVETSEILESKKHAPDAQQSDVTVPDESGDWHSSFRKSLGEIVSKNLSEPIRSHKDLDKDFATHFHKAVKFYEGISKQLIHQGHVLDLFACALDQVGIAELKVAVEKTGGLVTLAESFGHLVFKDSLKCVFQSGDDDLSLASKALM